MKAELEGTGNYRVLTRLCPPDPTPAPAEARTALYVDVETTGLDPKRDEIIELAMAPFYYLPSGEIVGAGEPYSALRQPSSSIPPAITELTGITDEMVAGRSIDVDEVASFAAGASLVIAHNATFDRRFLERLSDVFSTKPWACSMAEVPWIEEGYESLKLSHLAMERGFFYERHRALADCQAAIELLSQKLPRSGELAFARLLANARRPVVRIFAENSPFELKDRLKERGYRWNGEIGTAPRCWYVDVSEDQKHNELRFLQSEIFACEIDLVTRNLTAYDRYSDRC